MTKEQDDALGWEIIDAEVADRYAYDSTPTEYIPRGFVCGDVEGHVDGEEVYRAVRWLGEKKEYAETCLVRMSDIVELKGEQL